MKGQDPDWEKIFAKHISGKGPVAKVYNEIKWVWKQIKWTGS